MYNRLYVDKNRTYNVVPDSPNNENGARNRKSSQTLHPKSAFTKHLYLYTWHKLRTNQFISKSTLANHKQTKAIYIENVSSNLVNLYHNDRK